MATRIGAPLRQFSPSLAFLLVTTCCVSVCDQAELTKSIQVSESAHLLEEEEKHEEELVLKVSDLLRVFRCHGSPECWPKDVWIGKERRERERERERGGEGERRHRTMRSVMMSDRDCMCAHERACTATCTFEEDR